MLTTGIVCKAMYTGYRAEDVPGYAIDFIYAFKVSSVTLIFHSSSNMSTVTIRTQYCLQPLHLSRQNLLLMESVQAPLAQPLDQAHNHRPPGAQCGVHGRYNHYLRRPLPASRQIVGQVHPGWVL